MSSEINTVRSPCTGYCQLNDLDICLGCFRDLKEITTWSQANDNTRNFILTNTIARKKIHIVNILKKT
ncbi:MAG: DUF1289 domain-containing protein [Methylobacter sp.]|nr:DUF1289 domain-containing protein [Methylobacter sp.]